MRLPLIFIVALMIPKLSIAGGTLGTDELSPLIAQMPVIRDLLYSSVILSDSAYAEVRLGPHFKKLGGARMGPYSIEAKSKKDGSTLVVILCTKVRFLSSSGKELPEARIEAAESIEEKLTGVMLRQDEHAPSEPARC